MKISMTDFVDIVSASGLPKANKIRQLKHRPTYDPRTDFYKKFRDHLEYMHTNDLPRTALDSLLPTLTDEKKVANYPDLIKGYKKWWGKKSLAFFEAPSHVYSSSGVQIKVNPELGVTIAGQDYIVKLYLKSDPISKLRVAIVTHLMESSLVAVGPAGAQMAILDVRRAKLISGGPTPSTIAAAFAGEIAYIASTWPHV